MKARTLRKQCIGIFLAGLGLVGTAAASMPSADTSSLAKELLVIDADVAERETLLNGLDGAIEVVLIEGGRNGLAQMTAALKDRSGVDAIHIVSHGAPGALQLGGGSVTKTTLDGSRAEFATWRKALSADADILLYGCNVAAGRDGGAFVAALADVTGADVAASDDSTGAVARGGDWVLERTHGDVESEIVLSHASMGDYDQLLATFDFTTTSGSGTSTVTTTVSGVTLTVTDAAINNLQVIDAGTYAGTSGNVIMDIDKTSTSTTFSFDAAVSITSFRFADQGTGYTYVFSPSSGTDITKTASTPGETISPADWTGITSFTMTRSGGGSYSDWIVDTIVFTLSLIHI